MHPDRSTLLVEAYEAQAADIWRRFFDAYGPEVMSDCYGWDEPPRLPRSGEVVLEAWDGEVLVGWASVVPRPHDRTEVEIILGVWPDQVGQGYRMEILLKASSWAFLHMGADFAFVQVLDSNEEQQEKYMRDHMAGFPFRFCGVDWWPVGSKKFGCEKPDGEAPQQQTVEALRPGAARTFESLHLSGGGNRAVEDIPF